MKSMPEQTPKILNYFSFFRFSDTYWHLSTEERADFQENWLNKLNETAENIEIYQIFPAATEFDIMVWSAMKAEDTARAGQFFTDFARVTNQYRALLEAKHTLWGFTKPSQYTKARSTQEMDPFSQERKPYLILYPFVKTMDWYLMPAMARRGLMNEHISLGKEYPEITQLLLYSVGLQDQEFVVVYETDDLTLFSDLVNRLRGTEVRRYTERDTPLYTAIYHPAPETLALFR
jgi:chlorite dismutase